LPRERKIAEGSALRASRLFHREHADLVGRAEPVLDRPDHAEAAAGVALEIKDGIHHVLEHARAGDHAFARDMADQEYGRAGRLGESHQARRGFTQLRHRAGRAIETADGHRLDRVDDEHFCACLGDVLEDALDRSLGDQVSLPASTARRRARSATWRTDSSPVA
jgi:hypothetical protein